MPVSVTVNGVAYSFPVIGDEPPTVNWGPTVTSWAQSVSTNLLQKTGGTFTLTADVDFGATYGLKSTYYKSRAATPASAGVIRLGNAESLNWMNQAGNANLGLTLNTSNVLVSGAPINASYFTTATASPADDGILRLANNEGVAWRNAAGNGNIHWTVNASDLLESNGNIGALSFTTISANPASAGVIKLANNEFIKWRNQANNADLGIILDTANEFVFGAGTAGIQAAYFTGPTRFSGAWVAAARIRIENAEGIGWLDAAGTGLVSISVTSGNAFDFSATIAAPAFSSKTAGVATAGIFRMAKDDKITWPDGTGSGQAYIRNRTGDYFEYYGKQNANGVSSGAASALWLIPEYYSAAPTTMAIQNYIILQNATVDGNTTITDATAMTFDANPGTHRAVDSGTTKTTPGTVDAWVKTNVNGTIYYIPCYTSKTT